MGRRMCETSLRLLPITPYRHITFTFAGHLAARLGYDKVVHRAVAHQLLHSPSDIFGIHFIQLTGSPAASA